MSYKQQLVINQSQRLVLTPQLRQRIEMLQMTKLELGELVSQQLAENPVLEELAPEEVAVPPDEGNIDFTETPRAALNGSAELPETNLNAAERLDGADQSYSVNEAGEAPDFDAGYEAGAALSPEIVQAAVAGEAIPEAARDDGREPEIGERDSFEEIDYGTTFEEYLDPGYRTRETEVKETPSFEQFLRSEDSLADYLNWQLRLTITAPEVAAAAEVIIGNLNDDGYLDCSLEEITVLGPWPMETKETSKETRDYIKDRFRSAVDLLKNIEHRKQTIYKVCERIVERQRDFLDKGVEYLKPMMLKDISEDIGMHLSTVSRVVNGKYAHTPQGVIELRRFFTEGMVNDEGEEVSTRIIKLRIKKMIEAEDARNPLTDDEIAKTLAKEGQKLSRRTVAKYRDQMKIPGSRERRQVVS